MTLKLRDGDKVWGVICGPCDKPAGVFLIEDGVLDGDAISFFIHHTDRRNFMKDAHALSFEVEFIRQISFLRHRPKVVAVSSGFAPYRCDQDRRSLQAILDCWLASL